jgi:hypothetical protein
VNRKTLTAATLMMMRAQVIKVCAESAFDYSPFPVILSLENHCSLKQQDAMADILQKYMGNMLLLCAPLPFPLCLSDEQKTSEYYRIPWHESHGRAGGALRTGGLHRR